MKNNYDEIILLYLDNRMTDDEKRDFERELEVSPPLFERFKKVKDNFDRIKNSAYPGTVEDYFDNMVPDFRKRLESGKRDKRSLIPGYAAFAGGIGVVILFLLIFLLTSDTENNGSFDFADIDYTQLDDIFSYHLSDHTVVFSDASGWEIAARIDSVFAEQYLLADQTGRYLEHNFVIRSITEEEADNIYNQLINKDIISGDL
jgi:hypothetical protein